MLEQCNNSRVSTSSRPFNLFDRIKGMKLIGAIRFFIDNGIKAVIIALVDKSIVSYNYLANIRVLIRFIPFLLQIELSLRP